MDKQLIRKIDRLKDRYRRKTTYAEKAFMEIGRSQAWVVIDMFKEELYNRSDFYTGTMKIEKVYGLLSKIELKIKQLWQL